MNAIDFYVAAWREGGNFSGRASRSEYWWFLVFNAAVGLALAGFDSFVGAVDEKNGHGLTSTFYSLIAFFPWFAVSVRRMHDLNQSGWGYFGFTIILPAALGVAGVLTGSVMAFLLGVVVLIFTNLVFFFYFIRTRRKTPSFRSEI